MSLKQTVLLGLTGSIGMGKSTTAAMFLKQGIPVWDADSTVHKLYAKNGAAVKFFNQEIPSAVLNGEVSRVILKKLIKEDINNLKKIEQIVHPLVAKDRLTFIENSKKYNAPLIVLDIPLLFETGFYKLVDYIAVVTVDYTTQKQRVLDRESMTEEMDATIYQVMYGVYLANLDAFIGSNLTSIRADKDFNKPDKVMIQMMDPASAQQMVESFLN